MVRAAGWCGVAFGLGMSFLAGFLKGYEAESAVMGDPDAVLNLAGEAPQTVTRDLIGLDGKVNLVSIADLPNVHVYVCGLEKGDDNEGVWVVCYVRRKLPNGKYQGGTMVIRPKELNASPPDPAMAPASEASL